MNRAPRPNRAASRFASAARTAAPAARTANTAACAAPAPRAARPPQLSLVFPAWNEAENLPILIESATKIGEQLGVSFEIVIVDDGSRDETASVLARARARDPRLRSVRHATNQGYGAALRAGLREAQGELVFFSDADLQFDLREIADLLAHTNEFEIVAGYRAPRRDPWLRRGLARTWGWLVGALFSLRIRDIDCAFKIFRREVLDAIPIESVGAFINTEILVRAQAQGFRVRQVPVTHQPRRLGRQTGAHPRVMGRALVELAQLYRALPRAPESARRVSAHPAAQLGTAGSMNGQVDVRDRA